MEGGRRGEYAHEEPSRGAETGQGAELVREIAPVSTGSTEQLKR